ncbi:hypothetical protein HGRIS_013802 [Hohenbuehelia grisea]|uniref:Uncharacterized protein n=1 Tax=Hohenbuehelia grisea TaxID=104357 RepID=A0ABR3IWU6_9AGAR
MSSRLTAFSSPVVLRSSLVKNPPDAVPPTDELEALHAELLELRKKTLERAKKAGEDLKTIEESYRRMREREKGKAKVKREREYTPSLNGDEPRLSSTHSKPRNSSLPLNSLPPSARSSLDPRRSTLEDRNRKKKRRRERDDSDVEPEPQRPRKSTPPVTHSNSYSQPHPPKALKTPLSQSFSKAPSGPDFSLPSQDLLIPARPPVPPPPIPGPSKPTDVTDDFSKLRAPSQTLVTTFYTFTEPYIRPIKEEDVGFLEFHGDEVEPYILPKLGRHYTDVWEEEDSGLAPFSTETSAASFAAPEPKWDPSTLAEAECVTEEKGHGPLTERVISALLPIPDVMSSWKGVKAAEDAMEGRPGGSGAAAARKEKMNVSDLEARIRDTMRHHGLIDGMPDYSEKVDDPIATALRHMQRELKVVATTNRKRKERLAAIARDRLGYQEYLDYRDSIDRNINLLYAKLQKKDAPKLSRKKKKGASASETPTPAATANGTVHPSGSISALPPHPGALGLGPDDENTLVMPDQLKQLVELRRNWVDQVGSFFDQKELAKPGSIYGVPKASVFEGIDEEVRELLGQEAAGQQRTAGKGKGKLRADEMDVG